MAILFLQLFQQMAIAFLFEKIPQHCSKGVNSVVYDHFPLLVETKELFILILLKEKFIYMHNRLKV